MKTCPGCGVTKDAADFYSNGKKRLSHYCRSCQCGKVRACYREHAEERRAYARRNQLKRDSGITEDEYQELLAQQEGRCAICGISEDIFHQQFAVDHDHRTGNIRGLLCCNCNLMIGNGKDNPRILASGALYPERATISLEAVPA